MQEIENRPGNHSAILPGAVIHNTETGITGIVSKVQKAPECIFVSVSLDSHGRLGPQDLTMLPYACRPATVEEKLSLQHVLNKKHLVWDAHKRRIQEDALEIASGTYVRVSTLGENMIAGVFKEFDEMGRIVLYCWADKEGRAGYSQHEVIGPKENFQIQSIGSYARNMLNRTLARNGVVWNNRRHSLEHIVPTVESEDGVPVYYYFDDCFKIHRTQDTHRLSDSRRITVGNYFATEEEAEEVCECFRVILRLKSKAAAPGIRRKRK